MFGQLLFSLEFYASIKVIILCYSIAEKFVSSISVQLLIIFTFQGYRK